MIDQTKLIKMKNMGLTDEEIAKRLGCSRKTVIRAKKKLGVEKRGRTDKETEFILRSFFRDLGETGNEIASRFGITKQAILK